MIVKYCDNGLANDYIAGSIINPNGFIQNSAFTHNQQIDYSPIGGVINPGMLSVGDFEQTAVIKVKRFPEITIPSNGIITGQRDTKFILEDSNDTTDSIRPSSGKYQSISYYPDIQKNVSKSVNNDLNSISSKTEQIFNDLSIRKWPEDMQPSEETITRAKYLWIAIQNSILRLNIGDPNISAADENSIDMFWGNRKDRILINIPSSHEEMLFLHLITTDGQTVINFTDSHIFNILGVFEKLRRILE